jgi:hypothetical protein
MRPIDALRAGVEQYLRELPEAEFRRLVAVVRPPDESVPVHTGAKDECR